MPQGASKDVVTGSPPLEMIGSWVQLLNDQSGIVTIKTGLPTGCAFLPLR